MGFMQFNIIIVDACIYSCEIVCSLSNIYATHIDLYIRGSITMVVKYTIKEMSQVIIFIIILCIIAVHSVQPISTNVI
jgi:hypothetical protein